LSDYVPLYGLLVASMPPNPQLKLADEPPIIIALKNHNANGAFVALIEMGYLVTAQN
jgi:hypothetical protein